MSRNWRRPLIRGTRLVAWLIGRTCSFWTVPLAIHRWAATHLSPPIRSSGSPRADRAIIRFRAWPSAWRVGGWRHCRACRHFKEESQDCSATICVTTSSSCRGRFTTSSALPDLAVGCYDWVLAFDHREKRTWIISSGLPETEPWRRRLRAVQRLRAVRRAVGQASACRCLRRAAGGACPTSILALSAISAADPATLDEQLRSSALSRDNPPRYRLRSRRRLFPGQHCAAPSASGDAGADGVVRSAA